MNRAKKARLVFALLAINTHILCGVRAARVSVSAQRARSRRNQRRELISRMDELSSTEFRHLFRMERFAFDRLVIELQPHLNEHTVMTADRVISPKIKIAVPLFYLGGGMCTR